MTATRPAPTAADVGELPPRLLRPDAIATLKAEPGSERVLRMSRAALDRPGTCVLRTLGPIVAAWSVVARSDLAAVALANGALVFAAEPAADVAHRAHLQPCSFIVGTPERLRHERRRRAGFVSPVALRGGVRLAAAADIIAAAPGIHVELEE